MKVIAKIKTTATISIDRTTANRALNTYYYGQPDCNVRTPKGFVPIEHPNREALEAAHYNFCPNRLVEVEVELLEDGHLGKIRVIGEE